MVGGGRPARQRLRRAEREQDAGPALGRGRLLQRAAQRRDGGVGRAAADRGRARGLERVDHPGLASPRRREQLRGDLLRGRAGVA
jgi:hypothetical protein